MTLSPPPSGVRVGPDQAARVAAILTDAFRHEPLLDHWLRQGNAKDGARRAFFDYAVAGGVHRDAQLWMSSTEDAAAIWLPVGARSFDLPPLKQLAVLPLLYRIAGFAGLGRALSLGEHMARLHPHEPHMHLAFLGVRSDRQGRGLGSALLKSTLTVVDELAVAAYLETATPANVRLYERHGFDVAHEGPMPDGGPTFWTMLRPPQSGAVRSASA